MNIPNYVKRFPSVKIPESVPAEIKLTSWPIDRENVQHWRLDIFRLVAKMEKLKCEESRRKSDFEKIK